MDTKIKRCRKTSKNSVHQKRFSDEETHGQTIGSSSLLLIAAVCWQVTDGGPLVRPGKPPGGHAGYKVI